MPEEVTFLRLPQVLARFPVAESTWWAGVKDGRFPKQVKLTPCTSAWLKSDIDELCARVARESKQ